MPAINMWLAPLVYRLSFKANLPSATDNVWDVFPFNNADFCSRFGLAKGKGLLTPPEGAIGDQFSEEIKLKWPAKAAGAKRFLQWLDEEMRQWFTVQQSKTGGQTKAKGKKGKGKARQQSSNSKTNSKDKLNKIGAPIDKLQAGWKRNAPETNFKDWDWLIARAFGAPGSLFKQLRALMKEFSCDAKTAHKIERCQRDNKPFREADMATKTAFDQYWNNAQKSICLALFGSDALQLNIVNKKKSRVAKAICYCLFENDVRLLKRAVERSRMTKEELERAYQAAQIQFTMGNAQHMYRLLKLLLHVQRVCGIDILTDQNPWRDWIEKMLKERSQAMDADGNIVKVKATVAIVPDEVMDRMMDEYAEMLQEQQAKIIKDKTQDPQRQTNDAPNAKNDIKLWNQSIGTDAGVERWGRKTVAEVLSLLGVDAKRLLGRPKQCNKVPMWHQWVAVIEMVCRSFTSKLGEEGHPMLLADQVGLGKTIIIVIYIQVLWHLQQLQKTNKNWPNIGNNPGYKFWPEVLGKCQAIS
ncbi:hypothetical protein RHS04_09263 [Rhizoctonia solani]|uniref:Uncharacterized protein n=1 Tax=Rhizoctonia solani TaxID=456999 RepID=A0A8H7LFR9_9AGAM|nr:hypothetical protein RHS04_09263 [Rhizoctonia solani]